MSFLGLLETTVLSIPFEWFLEVSNPTSHYLLVSVDFQHYLQNGAVCVLQCF